MALLPLEEVFAVSKIRFRFIRGEEVKYISHLDMMKVFERAARRAQIPVAYSQGFNPHPQMVFGLPLSVGVTSEAEYADFEMAEEVGLDCFIEEFNKSLPKGFKITNAQYRYGKANIMATITKASYSILVSAEANEGIDLILQKTEKFLSQSSIVVKKESKSGVRDVDIRRMIHDVSISPVSDNGTDPEKMYNNLFCISALLSAGSAANLKPDLLVSALNAGTGLNIKILKIHRTGLFVERDGRTYDPLDFEILKVV